MSGFHLFMLIVAVSLFGASLLIILIKNKFVVQPNNRERMVLQDILMGGMDVLEPGTHVRAPHWKKLANVELNREPVQVPTKPEPGKPDPPGEEFSSGNTVLGYIKYRYDILTGRPFDLETGQLTVNPDDMDAIDEGVVLLAVTRIDYDERHQRVQAIVEAAVESVLGNYTARQLFPRAEEYDQEIYVPLQDIPRLGLRRQRVHTRSQMLEQLAHYIEAECNKKLTFVGINIVDFHISGLLAKDSEMQSDIEQSERSARVADAARTMQDASGGELSYREALAATDPTAFGPIAAAQAERFKAEQYAEAATRLAEAARDGLRNFGRG
jgi:hypothetical protein